MATHSRCNDRRVLLSVCAITALLVTMSPQTADAGLNFWAGVGVAKRTADAAANLKTGFAFQLHAELGLLPFLNVGPYYAHYQLGMSDVADASTAFNVLGLRARLIWPTGDFHPYAYVGAGYTAAAYSAPSVTANSITVPAQNLSGHFYETPIGVGLAYDVIPILQLFIEGAYRPATGFGGDAFPDSSPKPTSGYSALIGAAINL
jgi:hypothetical protein